jgi:hypothetical protein
MAVGEVVPTSLSYGRSYGFDVMERSFEIENNRNYAFRVASVKGK